MELSTLRKATRLYKHIQSLSDELGLVNNPHITVSAGDFEQVLKELSAPTLKAIRELVRKDLQTQLQTTQDKLNRL